MKNKTSPIWYVAKLENGNEVRVQTFGGMLEAAAKQNTRVVNYHIEE